MFNTPHHINSPCSVPFIVSLHVDTNLPLIPYTYLTII